ncbi:MAG: hypothetical protein ACYDB2_06260 [Acidimicrobiales bacterium]
MNFMMEAYALELRVRCFLLALALALGCLLSRVDVSLSGAWSFGVVELI